MTACYCHAQTLAATLYLHMWCKCYVSLTLSDQLWICAFHEQTICQCPFIGFSNILLPAWHPISTKRTHGFLLALVPVEVAAECRRFRAHRPELQHCNVRLWVITFNLGFKAHCNHNHRTCQGPLDFNMVAERKLREISAWAAQIVPAHCDQTR